MRRFLAALAGALLRTAGIDPILLVHPPRRPR